MARLFLQAEATGGSGASSGVAKPGNQAPLYIVVSIERSSGLPRTGLAAAHFAVDPIVVGAGGAGVTIHSVGEAQPGAYLVQVVPIPAGAWQQGNYIFWIAVAAGNDRGQTLCQTTLS